MGVYKKFGAVYILMNSAVLGTFLYVLTRACIYCFDAVFSTGTFPKQQVLVRVKIKNVFKCPVMRIYEKFGAGF